MNNFEVTIDRIEEKRAVIKTSDNETVVVPVSWLPRNVKEGSICHISIKDLQEKEAEVKNQARDILNEILDTTE